MLSDREDRNNSTNNQNENKELWTYGVDEPEEHEPWLFPQVLIGLRADQITSLADNEPPLEAIAAMSLQSQESNETQVMAPTIRETESIPPMTQMDQLKGLRSSSGPINQLSPISDQRRDYSPYGGQDLESHTMILEYLIYYEKNPDIFRPVAVFTGKFRQQIPYELRESSQFVKNDGIITIELMNYKDLEMMRDYADIRHSSDRITISPKNESIAYIFGERCGGITFGSDSVLQIKGILIELKNGILNLLGGGRHCVEPNSGALKFVICGNDEIVLIATNADYGIDDESYLDQDIRDRKSIGMQTESPVQAFHPKTGFAKTYTSTPISQRPEKVSSIRSQELYEAKPRSSKKSPKKRLKTEITRIESKDKSNIFGDSFSTTIPFIIYFIPNESHESVSEATAVLTGNIRGQIICHEKFDFELKNEIMRIELLNPKDEVMMNEFESIKNDRNMIKLQPKGDAIVSVFDQEGGGFVFGSDSQLIARGKYYHFENAILKPIESGEQTKDLKTKDLKIVLSSDLRIIVIP